MKSRLTAVQHEMLGVLTVLQEGRSSDSPPVACPRIISWSEVFTFFSLRDISVNEKLLSL